MEGEAIRRNQLHPKNPYHPFVIVANRLTLQAASAL